MNSFSNENTLDNDKKVVSFKEYDLLINYFNSSFIENQNNFSFLKREDIDQLNKEINEDIKTFYSFEDDSFFNNLRKSAISIIKNYKIFSKDEIKNHFEKIRSFDEKLFFDKNSDFYSFTKNYHSNLKKLIDIASELQNKFNYKNADKEDVIKFQEHINKLKTYEKNFDKKIFSLREEKNFSLIKGINIINNGSISYLKD